MLTAVQCLAKALEMDARTASETERHRLDNVGLGDGWRSIARTTRCQDSLIAAIGRIK